MAGNPGDPELPGDEPGTSEPTVTPPQPSPKPRVKTFACTNCGASVMIRYPGASMTAVCESCHSTIDVTDENYKILTAYFSKADLYFPCIPLGARGKLRGRTWEVIGFMVRSDVASKYFWMEYLLFNPYYGYRWLTEDRGNWSLVCTIKRKPEIKNVAAGFRTREWAILGNKHYEIYNKGYAQVDYVIGEFYWRVVMGSQVQMHDYIDPPEMLSMEKDDKEVVWSIGEYIEPKEIEEAFSVKDRLPAPMGIAANQPSTATASWKKISKLWMIFLGFITCAQIFFVGSASNRIATQYVGNFIPNTKQNDITVPVFTLDKASANVEISLQAPVSNSWFYVSGELVNNATGTSYPFERTAEYYYGTDSDGYWSEGSSISSLQISGVPGGQYYLSLDTESGAFVDTNEKQFTVNVRRDVPSYSNYWWFVFFLSIVPIWSWILMRREEVQRWANSDYSPYITSDS